MAITILAIAIFFIACAIYAYRAKAGYPRFTDAQLLDQHRRFLDEVESSRKYIGATYFHTVEKGSPAQAALTLRGFDVKKLLREHAAARRENREMDWNACRLATTSRDGREEPA